jgi:hypothetical protein
MHPLAVVFVHPACRAEQLFLYRVGGGGALVLVLVPQQFGVVVVVL